MEQQIASASEPEFAALVAIDWADQKHYWSLRAAGSPNVERGTLDNTPEAVEAWMIELHLRLGHRPIAIALEQRRGALVIMLSKYAQVHLFPVHPLTLARFREAWYPSRSKNDLKDADLLLEILTAHRARLRRLDPHTAEMRLLQTLVENRRKLVDQRTAVSNRLTDMLKIVFPQVLRWFDDVASPLVGDLIEHWPSLQDLQKVKTARLEKFLRQHHCRGEDHIRERLSQIRLAVPATDDPTVTEAAKYMMLCWARQLAVLQKLRSRVGKTHCGTSHSSKRTGRFSTRFRVPDKRSHRV